MTGQHRAPRPSLRDRVLDRVNAWLDRAIARRIGTDFWPPEEKR